MKRRYGWQRDLPGRLDIAYRVPERLFDVELPPAIDLSERCSPVEDQGQLGSCVGNAVVGALEYCEVRYGMEFSDISRLFVYYNARKLEGATDQDAGCQIRDAIQSITSVGACSEALWPYDIARYADTPPLSAYTDAKQHRVTQSALVDPEHIRHCLAEDFPVVLGFTVYESFESDAVASTGIVPLPKQGERMLGGHAVLVVGYDDAQRQFKVRNSWGTGWGQDGYCQMPYEYLTSSRLAADRWTIRRGEGFSQ